MNNSLNVFNLPELYSSEEDIMPDVLKYLILDFLKQCGSPRVPMVTSFAYAHLSARRCSPVFKGLGLHGVPVSCVGKTGCNWEAMVVG